MECILPSSTPIFNKLLLHAVLFLPLSSMFSLVLHSPLHPVFLQFMFVEGYSVAEFCKNIMQLTVKNLAHG